MISEAQPIKDCLKLEASEMPGRAADAGGVHDIVRGGLVGSIVPAVEASVLPQGRQQSIDHPYVWTCTVLAGGRFMETTREIVMLIGTFAALSGRLGRRLASQRVQHVNS